MNCSVCIDPNVIEFRHSTLRKLEDIVISVELPDDLEHDICQLDQENVLSNMAILVPKIYIALLVSSSKFEFSTRIFVFYYPDSFH